jgi:tetratricopeptide (TPR) repeat protein
MPLLPILSLLFAQLAMPATVEQDRLNACVAQARGDPATAMVTASTWLAESVDSARSAPQQCLGIAYVSLLRWEAAEQAFLAARDARPRSDFVARARLAAMAGNAALAEQRHQAARDHFAMAQADAAIAGDPVLSGEIAIDRAQALVGLGALDEAAEALSAAQRDAPQNTEAWLLSAALARRQGNLEQAQAEIQTAATLAPGDPAVGLEAGLIAALLGHDEAARQSWRSIVELAPQGPEAGAAREYLRQLDSQAPTP